MQKRFMKSSVVSFSQNLAKSYNAQFSSSAKNQNKFSRFPLISQYG